MKFSNSPLAAAAIAAAVAPATYAMEMPIQVHHRTIRVENVEVFYREAGSPDAPAILLLPGFGRRVPPYRPRSSRFRPDQGGKRRIRVHVRQSGIDHRCVH